MSSRPWSDEIARGDSRKRQVLRRSSGSFVGDRAGALVAECRNLVVVPRSIFVELDGQEFADLVRGRAFTCGSGISLRRFIFTSVPLFPPETRVSVEAAYESAS